jgi:AcrR family transcriptional regulator
MSSTSTATQRRRGDKSHETWGRILDVTEHIMVTDGYAAATSRRIAREAGITPAAVHYYFGTLDKLFLALIRRRADQQLQRHRQIREAPQPLHRLWQVSNDRAGASLLAELLAMSNHRKSIRGELLAYAAEFRDVQLEALSGHLARVELNGVEVPPVALVALIASLSPGLVAEEALGLSAGLSEAHALIEQLLDLIEPA